MAQQTPAQVQASIRRKAQTARNQLSAARVKLETIQRECLHPDVLKLPKSDTGNWDRSQDRYWYDCTCPDCGKKWTEDQ